MPMSVVEHLENVLRHAKQSFRVRILSELAKLTSVDKICYISSPNSNSILRKPQFSDHYRIQAACLSIQDGFNIQSRNNPSSQRLFPYKVGHRICHRRQGWLLRRHKLVLDRFPDQQLRCRPCHATHRQLRSKDSACLGLQ